MTEGKIEVGHLVVVAGPTAVGKSTFAERLVSDPDRRREVGMERGSWTIVQANKAHKLAPGHYDRLVFHYDLLWLTRRGKTSYEEDRALHLFRAAKKITILTIGASRPRLLDQLWDGEIKGRDRETAKWYLFLMDRYEEGSFLFELYTKWLEFCAGFAPAERLFVENCGDFRVMTREDWTAVCAN